MNAAELHADAIVIDTTCPLARIHKYLDWYREGGATAIAPTITGASGNARSGFAMIGGWHRYVRERNDALIVYQAEDIEQAKREGKVGLILHCQGTAIVEDEIDLLDAYHEAGLRVVQLCYNTKNLVGDGASERTIVGSVISGFGWWNAVLPWVSWLTAHTPDIVPAWMRLKRLTLLLSSLMPMPAPCRITAAMSRMN